MSILRQAWARLVSFFRKRELDHDFNDELASHIDLAAEEYERQGLPTNEARRQALIDLGGIEPSKEAHRDTRGLPWLDGILQDIRFAVRSLRRSPGFTLSSIVVLSLAIGINTAMFSVIEAVILRPLPYRDADGLVMLWKSVPSRNIEWDWSSYPVIRDWRERNSVFEDLAFMLRPEGSEITLDGNDGLRKLQSSKVSQNLFSVLDVAPILGSVFPVPETNPVVLSHKFWRQELGADERVLGHRLQLDGNAATVVGVMPPGFEFPDKQTQLWMPIIDDARWSDFQAARMSDAFGAVARLKPNVDIAQARAEMAAIATTLGEEHPSTDAELAVRVVPISEQVTSSSVRWMLWTLGGAAFCVLLIACSNVASLLAARSFTRRKELKMRAALGAGRWRLVWHLAVEKLLLCLAGGTGGLLLAEALLSSFLAYAPSDLPRTDHLAINWAVLAFALGLSAFASAAFGVLPALRVAKDLQIYQGSRGRPPASVSRWFVAGQFAVTIVLLTGAGLLTRSFVLLNAVEPRFETVGLLTAEADAPQDVWGDRIRSRQFLDEAVRSIERIPGVRGAAVGSAVVDSLLGNVPNVSLKTESAAGADRSERHARIIIGDNYFGVLGIPLLRGRPFSQEDTLYGPKVAVINQAMADRFWPGQDPLGKRFQEVYPGLEAPWLRVIGVVSDAIHNKDGRVAPVLYLSKRQRIPRNASFVVRAQDDALPLAGAIRQAVQNAEPLVPYFEVISADQLLAAQDSPRVFQTLLLSAFAGASLLLTGFGLFALVMYGVQQRTQEIGIRTVLGATSWDVVRLVVVQSLRWAGTGAAVGVAGALLFGRALSAFLFGISPTDPLTLTVAAGLLVGIAGLAAALPAYRAFRIPPTLALRHD